MENTIEEEEGVGTFISRGHSLKQGQIIKVRNQDHKVIRKANTALCLGCLYLVVPMIT